MDAFLAPIVIGVSLAGVCVVSVYRASKFDYRCTNCKKLFKANSIQATFAPQSRGKKYLFCPNCRRKYLCDLVYRRK